MKYLTSSKYLNLTNGFDPFKTVGLSSDIPYESFVFKGGEPHIKIDVNTFNIRGGYSWADEIIITQRIESFKDIGLLLIAVDALRRINKNWKIHLFLPYFPGARQDRVMVKGEPLTVKIYTDLINNLNFKSVTIFDPHSDVTLALIDNVNVIDNHKFVLEVLTKIYPQINAKLPILISPDAGANKKVIKLAQYLSKYTILKIVKCDKTRDVTNGNITGFEVYADDLKDRDCIIVDDICDGGGTFIGLVKELKKKNCGKLYLVVSHGIFSKGFKELLKYFDEIYTTDSVNHLKYFDGVVPKRINVIKLNRVI